MDEDTLTAWLDTALLMLGSFVLMTVLMLTVMNPPAKSSEADVQATGNVTVEIQWPNTLDADVDLWLQAPGDRPVGYSNTNGKIFNLLRDDLGRANDMTDLNYEVAYSRGMPAGEYAVNVHLYRGISGVSIPVKVVVSAKTSTTGPAQQLSSTTVELRHNNQELTVMRFRLDDHGSLVTGSMNSLFKALRVASQ